MKLTVKIYGRVQGVGFRFEAKEIAQKLNLVGLARNEKDGSVYIEAYGPKENLLEFLRWCSLGPTFAKIEDIKYDLYDKEDDSISYKTFEIL